MMGMVSIRPRKSMTTVRNTKTIARARFFLFISGKEAGTGGAIVLSGCCNVRKLNGVEGLEVLKGFDRRREIEVR